MSDVLRISVHFLFPEPSFHGKRDGGEPEWPPSPLRLFQALVNAAASRWRESQFRDHAEPALDWLQGLPPPEIVSPSHVVGTPFRISVPNNDLNSPASYWVRGLEPDKPHRPVDLRTMKTLQPVRMRASHGEQPVVHFLFPLSDVECLHLNMLRTAASSVTHVGWGIDVAAVDVEVISPERVSLLAGHRWRASESRGVLLRVPVAQTENGIGTLRDLMRRHGDLLARLPDDGFIQADRLSCFKTVRYHSPTADVEVYPPRPFMAFELHRTIDDQENNPGKTRFRPFHHVRKVATVAGMVRHAVADVAPKISSEWDAAKVASVIHGHREDADSQNRFQFLPVPSLTPVGVSGIRRVLVVGPAGVDIDAFRRRLHGVQLVDCKTQHPMAMLSYLSTKDRSLKDFLDPSPTWTTVTPVILPGYDDPDGLRRRMKTNPVSADEQRRLLERLDARILALIWKAFHQAGWTSDALAGAEVEYRRVGFLRGLDLASRYELPPIKFPRYHLRVRFPRPVSGPIAIGSGRFRGLGFFAAEDDAHL